MPKKEKIPTYEEIIEYKNHFSADPIHNRIDGVEHSAMLKEMTQRIFALNLPEDLRALAWKYCLSLMKYSHAPVSPADYKRMEKWLNETALIDILLEALKGYYPDSTYHFDTIGYYYSIALISQSQYRREDCLKILEELTNFCVSTKYKWSSVPLRNMTKLVKDYPDLAGFKAALEAI